jgi:glycosyltransferase involved in cell wall biosynthesis
MKFAVIIPFKTNRGWLECAIESVNEQLLKDDHEIIIVESQSDNTVGHNINEGFKAIGEPVDFVRFLCDDDELTITSVQDSIDYFIKHPDVDFFHSNADTINGHGGIISEHVPRYTPTTAHELASKNYLHGGTVVYRSKCFEAQPWDVDAWTGEEYEYNIRLLANGFKLGYNNAKTYRYRKHPNQKSARTNRNLTARIKYIKGIKAKYKNK